MYIFLHDGYKILTVAPMLSWYFLGPDRDPDQHRNQIFLLMRYVTTQKSFIRLFELSAKLGKLTYIAMVIFPFKIHVSAS